MKNNPLALLKTNEKNKLKKTHEAFAGPYNMAEWDWLASAALDAIRLGHGVHFSLSKKGTKSTAVIYLERSRFNHKATQPLDQIFDSITEQTAAETGVETQMFRTCKNAAECFDWIRETRSIGHIPCFVSTGNGFIPAFKRVALCSQHKSRKQHTN